MQIPPSQLSIRIAFLTLHSQKTPRHSLHRIKLLLKLGDLFLGTRREPEGSL